MNHLWFVDVFSRRNGSKGSFERPYLLLFFFANPKVKGWVGFWEKVVSYGTRCCLRSMFDWIGTELSERALFSWCLRPRRPNEHNEAQRVCLRKSRSHHPPKGIATQ